MCCNRLGERPFSVSTQGVSGRDENEQSFPHAGSNTDKVFLHVTIFVVVFVLIMPHRTIVPILCSDSLRCDRITLIVFGIKLVASSLYVAGWMQIGRLALSLCL